MFDAISARTQVVDRIVTETEIALLNLNVITAIMAGNASVQVTGNTVTMVNNVSVTGTPMTTTVGYYAAWQGTNTDTVKPSQMQAVIDNFTKLGYSISRQSPDGQYISWTLSW